ncbi:hypothetical protein KJ765_06280 [Candidatus Micrarchaeota archaeon]|nr:hypothetical protein [Candidatus Micrarchaeota archaeon]
MAGLFSADVLVALLLLVLTISVLFISYQREVSDILFTLGLSESERVAIQSASLLLSTCSEQGGLLYCDNGFRTSNALDVRAVGSLSPETISFLQHSVQTNQSLRVVVETLSGSERGATGTTEIPRTCVRRLAFMHDDRTGVVLEVCVS